MILTENWKSAAERQQFDLACQIALIINGIGFAVYGLVYLVFGIHTICSLKSFFNSFYLQNKYTLVVATIVLSTPLILRALVSFSAANEGVNVTDAYDR